VGLSTKNEQELGLGLESMVKINDPSPLPIPDWQSKMLPGWVWGFKNYLVDLGLVESPFQHTCL
jgi:hypothetical protein